MSQPDLEQLDRDQLVTERGLERDAHREPANQHRHPRRVRPSPLAERRRWQASMQDAINATATMSLSCPTCSGPVFAPRDSHLEVVTCTGCGAELLTRRGIDGGVDLVVREPGGAP